MSPIRSVSRQPAALREGICADGYLRLTPRRLWELPLRHLFSGLDVDPVCGAAHPVGATATAIAGYTEWSSGGWPAVSLGWDWVAEVTGRVLRYCRQGEPRSNVMLVGRDRRDFGSALNAIALGFAVDELPWQGAIAAFVASRGSSVLSDLTVT